MRILQLCKKFPYPLKDGESIAVSYLSRALHQLGAEIDLLAMNTVKHKVNVVEFRQELDYYTNIEVVDIDNSVRWQDAFSNLFTKQSYHISRFKSDEFSYKLIELLKENKYDILLLESLYLAPYISVMRKYSEAKIVQRSHNVEFEIWQRIAGQTKNVLKQLYLFYLANKLKKYEIGQLNNYDLLMPISARDLTTFISLGFHKEALTVPIGLDMAKYEAGTPIISRNSKLAFIGSLDWIPNQEGLNWFLKEAWPEINTKFPQLEFHIAGRNMPESYLSLNIPNVTFHGEVESAIDFLNAHEILIVPLFSGSGMRAKILEGLALGRIVICSRLALEGIEANDKQEVLLAETAFEYLQSIEFLIKHPEEMTRISEQARNFVRQHYDHLAIASTVMTRLQKLIDMGI